MCKFLSWIEFTSPGEKEKTYLYVSNKEAPALLRGGVDAYDIVGHAAIRRQFYGGGKRDVGSNDILWRVSGYMEREVSQYSATPVNRIPTEIKEAIMRGEFTLVPGAYCPKLLSDHGHRKFNRAVSESSVIKEAAAIEFAEYSVYSEADTGSLKERMAMKRKNAAALVMQKEKARLFWEVFFEKPGNRAKGFRSGPKSISGGSRIGGPRASKKPAGNAKRKSR